MGSENVDSLDALLAKHHVDLTARELLRELDAALTEVPPASDTLSAGEIEFLRTTAGEGVGEVLDQWSPAAEVRARAVEAARQTTAALADSLGTKEAAELLGIDRSAVSRRLTARALWSFDLHGHRRIPRWQFVGDDVLPGLGTVVAAIPSTAGPVPVAALMHTPQPDLGGRTPLEHLATGADPTPVAALLSSLDTW
ncbi:helix-turn-helix domain-containing protein [Rhodococcus sp. HNM0569]|uniref:helix-turn-helix domain-containing protein n=1 Tax=Rhodococcus sp. HNM0569 TaxID=2716340 RepID=UPI00146CABC8|nr:helix-turn-helix domain-containing protein [Rhodococcus sp. HNM0569]NLU84334.1 helix-turn-helix domain-containing protein [Rhodococcus sp. HNM0569]